MTANDVQNQKITDFLKANGWEYDVGLDGSVLRVPDS